MEIVKSFMVAKRESWQQGCQIFLGETYQNGDIYTKLLKINQMDLNISNRLKIDQMAISYTNILN
jgi:hypothetical protein